MAGRVLRTEDQVRDDARNILGLNDKPGVQTGVGQITTFNQLGFTGVIDKPDGWYLPDDHSSVALILEVKSEKMDIKTKKCIDEIKKNCDIALTQYKRVIGLLYNGKSVFVQEDLSPVYMQYTVRKSIADDNKAITQIHMYCVYESFVKLGWLFTEYMPRKFVNKLDVKKSVAILVDKLRKTRDHKNKRLFRSMLDILTQVDETCTGESFCFGTERFELIWERLIDRAFGIKDKRSYFPRTRWLLLHKKNKNNFPLVPDTIMIWDEKIYVLDAKYYNYGVTGNADHLPDSSSINKQITYGEYVAKQRQDQNVFNAFLIPYNSKENVFGMHTMFANIGMTVGDWKDNTHNYEKVQGILVDTRYLMYHYESKDNICALAESIQVALRVNNWLL